jgi:multiple sugar transport system substrate-binding protein
MKKVYWAAVVALGGCGGEDSPNPMTTPNNTPVTVSFLRHDNPDYDKADDAFFADYTAGHPNVKVMDTTVRYPTLGSTLLADLKSDKLSADFVRIQPSWVCTFADNLLDVPNDVATLSEAQNTFFAAPLQGSTCNGKLKALPVEYNLEYGGVVVNVDKYNARFGKTPSWTTWEAFIDEASKLTEWDTSGKPLANGLDIAPDWPQPVKHIFFSLILQRGGNYWAAGNPNAFDFKTQAAVDSFTDMVNWIKTRKVMDRRLVPDKNTFVTTRLAIGSTGYGWDDPTKPLSLMGYCGTWGVPSTVSQLPAGNTTKYDFYPLPPMMGNQHKFVQNSGWALAVPKTAKNPKAAWDVIKAMVLSPDAMRKWAAITGALPALKANGTAAAAAANPLLAKVQPLLESGQWVGYIPAGAIETVEGAIVSNYFDAVAGTKSIDQALTEMQNAANSALAANR